MKWISVEDKLPKEEETIWLYNINDNFILLGCLIYGENGWLWAISNGVIYMDSGKIVSECECDDDYYITHWIPLPKPPTKYAKQSNS